jgi:plastocyanin
MRLASLAALAALCALALSGCSSDSTDDSDHHSMSMSSSGPMMNMTMGAPVSLKVSAEGLYPANPSLSPAELTVAPGAMVTLAFTNNDPNPAVNHDWHLDDGNNTKTQSVASGKSSTVTFMAPMKAGDYAYYCDIGNHRMLGMEGVLHVKA